MLPYIAYMDPTGEATKKKSRDLSWPIPGATPWSNIIFHLIGGIPTPLKNMSSSDWIIIPTIGENKTHVSNHQPVIVQNRRRKHGFAKDELTDLGPLNGANIFGWELVGIATGYQLLMIINQHQPLITAIHWTIHQYQPFSNQPNTIRKHVINHYELILTL